MHRGRRHTRHQPRAGCGAHCYCRQHRQAEGRAGEVPIHEGAVDELGAGLSHEDSYSHVGGPGQQIPEGVHLPDVTGVHEGNAIGQRGCLRLIVSDVESRDAEALQKPFELNTGMLALHRIQVGERLIHQENLGVAHQTAGDGHLLALSDREALGHPPQQQIKVHPQDIVKATIAANSTMMHLLLGLPAASIRLSPFVTTVNRVPLISARQVGLRINPEGVIDCLPGVASYVGADITAGVYSSGMDHADQLTLFMDVGTNGEIVLGSREWLVTCACSAGPAFEGAGVFDGMRATKGAIEEVWINETTFEPTYRVIGGCKPKGLCGSGLISLLAEMFMTGVVDKAGNINTHLTTARIREGPHGLEYVIAWGVQSETGREIVITHVDIDNLIRAKGAIYAGYSVLADSVGVPMEWIEQMLIGGSFGKYINIEKAVQIGLLPDMPWERFQFLGNTSVKGAYYALLDRDARARIEDIASRMTYVELSADNSFYDSFMSALFLPHTDLARFPSVVEAQESRQMNTISD